MSVKLLTEHCLEFVSLKEAAQARLSLHLSKCHIVLRLNLRYFGFEPMRTIRWVHSYLKEKEKFRQVPQI